MAVFGAQIGSTATAPQNAGRASNWTLRTLSAGQAARLRRALDLQRGVLAAREERVATRRPGAPRLGNQRPRSDPDLPLHDHLALESRRDGVQDHVTLRDLSSNKPKACRKAIIELFSEGTLLLAKTFKEPGDRAFRSGFTGARHRKRSSAEARKRAAAHEPPRVAGQRGLQRAPAGLRRSCVADLEKHGGHV